MPGKNRLPDNRLDWRDPEMPVLAPCMDDVTGEVSLEPIDPKTFRKINRYNFKNDPAPHYLDDPTYDLAGQRRRKNMTVELKPVQSSQIEAIGHDPETHQLHIKFKDGALWCYDGVTKDFHDALVSAKSIGSHFHKYIRSNFPATKL